ncbi:MAG: hypothetical protein EZS28_022609 [Streblomastix strix]|uniref:Uncharacterized protein n=1 Tax=Streblomastix strix TaxID=222440 RepID=A0A5J4VH23_9EUKA|nr:MAG: hypothetical protein EZS28_022609 [Streblomastix strix]
MLIRTSHIVALLRDKNDQTIAKILQLVYRQWSIKSLRTAHEMTQSKSLPTSTSQLDSQSTGKIKEGQGTSDSCSIGFEESGMIKSIERDESQGSGSGASRGVSGEDSSEDGSESISLTKKDESDKVDKHSA